MPAGERPLPCSQGLRVPDRVGLQSLPRVRPWDGVFTKPSETKPYKPSWLTELGHLRMWVFVRQTSGQYQRLWVAFDQVLELCSTKIASSRRNYAPNLRDARPTLAGFGQIGADVHQHCVLFDKDVVFSANFGPSLTNVWRCSTELVPVSTEFVFVSTKVGSDPFTVCKCACFVRFVFADIAR